MKRRRVLGIVFLAGQRRFALAINGAVKGGPMGGRETQPAYAFNQVHLFLWPLIAITSTSQTPLPLGLAAFQGAHSTERPLLMAGNLMTRAPMRPIFFGAPRS